jgi:geranylgeranyl reductase family protein
MHDLIIIGGGPAGSSAARKASSLGLKTLLIEKDNFPRYKPCGGAVSDRALSYLDFQLPSTLPVKEMQGVCLVYKGQKVVRRVPRRIGILVDRKSFDDFLLKMAGESGAKIMMGEKAVDFIEKKDGLTVTTNKGEYRARFLIIAEGAIGNLQYKVKERPRKNEYAIALVAEIEEDDAAINERLDNVIEVHTDLLKMGFGWVFPHHGYYSVGIAGIAAYLSKPMNKMRQFLDAAGFRDRYQIKGHVIPAGGIKRRLLTSRVILTGDAAGFVDSFYGEGISYAIRSGQIASETISRIIRGERSVSLYDYESGVNDEFAGNLRYSLLASRLAHSMPLFFEFGIGNERLVDRFVDIALQKITYKELLKWLIPRLPWYFLSHVVKKMRITGNNGSYYNPPR